MKMIGNSFIENFGRFGLGGSNVQARKAR